MIFELHKRGQENIRKAEAEAEKLKVGYLRGGSAGILFENGDHAGTCAAQAYLRMKGINTSILEKEESESGGKGLMFQAGRMNEDAWHETLKHSEWKGTILREEEIPLRWVTDSGTNVSGRPDMVLLDEEKTAVLGIELKLVSAIWTARSVLIKRTPKLGHLIQSAHYMWKMGVPFELWYTNRTNFETSADSFNLRDYPAYGTEDAQLFEFRFYRYSADPRTGGYKKKAITEEEYLNEKESGNEVAAEPAKYKPFVQGFKLSFDTKGRLWYVDACDPAAEAKLTVITRDRIGAYFEYVSTLKQVPREIVTIKPDGERENWKLSNYCSLGQNCCKFKAGAEIDGWSAAVQGQVSEEQERRVRNGSGDTPKEARPEKPKRAAKTKAPVGRAKKFQAN